MIDPQPRGTAEAVGNQVLARFRRRCVARIARIVTLGCIYLIVSLAVAGFVNAQLSEAVDFDLGGYSYVDVDMNSLKPALTAGWFAGLSVVVLVGWGFAVAAIVGWGLVGVRGWLERVPLLGPALRAQGVAEVTDYLASELRGPSGAKPVESIFGRLEPINRRWVKRSAEAIDRGSASPGLMADYPRRTPLAAGLNAMLVGANHAAEVVFTLEQARDMAHRELSAATDRVATVLPPVFILMAITIAFSTQLALMRTLGSVIDQLAFGSGWSGLL